MQEVTLSRQMKLKLRKIVKISVGTELVAFKEKIYQDSLLFLKFIHGPESIKLGDLMMNLFKK